MSSNLPYIYSSINSLVRIAPCCIDYITDWPVVRRALSIAFGWLCMSTMSDSTDQVQKWIHFSHPEIMSRFRAQVAVPGSLTLRPFFAAEMARISAGCASDNRGLSTTATGFHAAWQRDSAIRMQTRANGLHVFNDMVGHCC